MGAPDCYGAVNFCALRFTRLNEDGTIEFGTDVTYVTESGIEMSASPITSDAERFEQRNGCGELCVVFDDDCDRVTGYELGAQLCSYEARLAEIATGGSLLTIGGTVVGFADPDPLGACYNGVVAEAWALAWNGDERALDPVTGDPAYWRFVYPKVKFRADEDTLANGVAVFQLAGKATPNSQAGTGPECDWPAIVTGPRAWFLDSTIPTAACDYADLVACTS